MELVRHLATAPASFLEGAMENPAFSEREALLLLRNHRATSGMLRQLASVRRWVAERPVRKALVRHPQVPPGLAARLLPEMLWKDLAETRVALSAPAAVRYRAEEILRQRLEELTCGERIALARSASRGLIPDLLKSDEAGVLHSLLGNPLLLESEAQTLARRSRPRELLSALASHPRWREKAAIVIALAGNPETPVRDALGLVSRLDRRARQQLTNDDKVPTIVRVAAERAPLRRAPSGIPETHRPRVRPRGHRS